MNYSLLKQICSIHSPSGNEGAKKAFLINYINENKHLWSVEPQIIDGEEFQDSFLLVFGKPRTAIFAHLDTIGFTVRYDNKLVPIGGPEVETGFELVGRDTKGEIETKMVYDEETHYLTIDFNRPIDRGTELVFKCNFRETDEYVQSCYLDNSLGILNALEVAKTLKDGVICFSCFEETGGGSVPFLSKYIYENYKIKHALISDITWLTEGVIGNEGVVVSMRDKNIPRRSFIDKIIALTEESGIPFQLEVEASGSSDGREVHHSPYPIDWVFIGAGEENVHSPNEKVFKKDFEGMVNLYKYLMEKL